MVARACGSPLIHHAASTGTSVLDSTYDEAIASATASADAAIGSAAIPEGLVIAPAAAAERGPAAPLPAQYGAGLAATGADAAALDWRGYFTDPALQRLIEQPVDARENLRIGDFRHRFLGFKPAGQITIFHEA